MRTELYRSPDADRDKPLVVLVDDEPAVLDALVIQLGREFRLVTATDGEAALAGLADHGPAAAVVSDMRMPGMNGIELLHRVQIEHPLTTRILHTGYGDVTTAVAAINSGGVYRYLAKPAGTEELRAAIRESVEQSNAAVVRHELLDNTLRTSVKAVFGVLELSSPLAYQRAGRITALAGDLCQVLRLGGRWAIEAAAMASQLGAVTVPADTLLRVDRGLPLSTDEQVMVDAMPRIALRLLGGIPMLEEVVAIVEGLTPAPAVDRPALVEDGIAVVRTAIGFEGLQSRGVTIVDAITALEEDGYAPHVLTALRRVKRAPAVRDSIRTVRVVDLQVGTRLVEDVVAVNGLVLIGRDTVLTESLLDRLSVFSRAVELVETVLAAVPERLPALSRHR